ncbi:hypothetical protein, partial [Methanobrevibacter boviskoreani]|uniref:hypothetical protein n=1 Tax=Methanobrevibacter boviskoreani TaxID=1348249 RepID=UPI0023A7C905
MGLDACDLGSEYNVVSKSVKTKSVVKAIKTVRPEIKKGIQENVWKIVLTKGYYKYTKNKVIGENKKEIAKGITNAYFSSKCGTIIADYVFSNGGEYEYI